MKTHVGKRGEGKTELIIGKALYFADAYPNDNIVIVSATSKRAALLKKRICEKLQIEKLPKNFDVVGADALFSRKTRGRSIVITRYFFDDLDQTLQIMCENVTPGKSVVEMITTNEDD